MATNKLLWSSKIIGVFFMMLVCTLSANAQFLRTSYFMEGTHYRQQLNPALTPTKGYFNLPVIGAVNATVGSTSLGYQDIIDIIDDGDDFYKSTDFMNRLKDKNKLNVNFSTEILSAGWYKGKNFWSFNIGLRTDIGANVTKNLFTFLNQMDGEGFEENWRTSNYNLSGQKMNIQAYTEVGLGLSRQINSRLSVGGKVKVLLGIGNMDLKFNKVTMSADIPSDARLAQLQDPAYLAANYNTTNKAQELLNEINKYHASLGISATLESSFKGLELVNGEEPDKKYIDDLKTLTIREDLVKKHAKDLKIMGFISWKKGATKIANATSPDININVSDYTKDINVDDLTSNDLGKITDAMTKLQTEAEKYYNRAGSNGDIIDYDMLQMEAKDADKSRKSRLASTLVLGAEYGFFNNKLAVGVLSTTRFVQPDALTELTFSANYRPKSWFNVALSYSAIQSAGKSFGLGLKLGPLFVGTDYMFLGKNSNSVNGFVGVSIPLGGRKANKEG